MMGRECVARCRDAWQRPSDVVNVRGCMLVAALKLTARCGLMVQWVLDSNAVMVPDAYQPYQ